MKSNNLLKLMAVLFLTFGVTYLDFDDFGFMHNLRPYLMLILGLISLIAAFASRGK
jgi:hypothetical protein